MYSIELDFVIWCYTLCMVFLVVVGTIEWVFKRGK